MKHYSTSNIGKPLPPLNLKSLREGVVSGTQGTLQLSCGFSSRREPPDRTCGLQERSAGILCSSKKGTE